MKQFKTLSEFKKVLAVGDKLACTWHMAHDGRDENGQMKYKSEERPVREVTIKQTNAFTLKTEKTDGEVVDSWCYYPKASECKVEDNVLHVFERCNKNRELPENERPLVEVLTYRFV
jgi:hypothetical protein